MKLSAAAYLGRCLIEQGSTDNLTFHFAVKSRPKGRLWGAENQRDLKFQTSSLALNSLKDGLYGKLGAVAPPCVSWPIQNPITPNWTI